MVTVFKQNEMRQHSIRNINTSTSYWSWTGPFHYEIPTETHLGPETLVYNQPQILSLLHVYYEVFF